jgi:cell division septation protein DedD
VPQAVQPATPIASSSFANAFATPVLDAPASRKPRWNRAVPATLPTPKAHNGTHLVQLGSFSSSQNAQRAWQIYASQNHSLRNYHLVITPAVVNGKNFWRVAAAGFDSRSAVSMCSSLRNRGGACFAYSANRAPTGAAPASTPRIAGPQMARRR